MTESQASNNLSQSDSNSNGNDTRIANTFLINTKHNNNHSDGNNTTAQHTIEDLASTNDNTASAHGLQNDTIRTGSSKIQTSKFIDNKLRHQNVDDSIKSWKRRENRIFRPEKWSRLVMVIRENIVVRYTHFMFYMNTWTDILNVQNIEHGKIPISKKCPLFLVCAFVWLEFISNSVNFRNPPSEFYCSQLHFGAILNSISFRRCIAVSHILSLISVV